MNTIITFFLGGIICGIVAFFVAACLFRAPIEDGDKYTYTDGYRVGWNNARNYYESKPEQEEKKDCADCTFLEVPLHLFPCYACKNRSLWKSREIHLKDCPTCYFSGRPTYKYPCTVCNDHNRWEANDDQEREITGEHNR